MTEPTTELVATQPAIERRFERSAALAAIRGAVLQMDADREALVKEGNVDALAEGGQDLQALIGDLHTVMDRTRRDLSAMVDARADDAIRIENERRMHEWQAKADAIPCKLCGELPVDHFGDERACGMANDAWGHYEPRRKVPKEPTLLKIKDTGPKRLEVEGVGLLESNGGWTRKGWRSEELLDRLLRIALDDLSIFTPDGEDGHPEAYRRLHEVLTETMPITSSLSWRTGRFAKGDQPATGLKAFGVDDADWCSREAKPRLVTIPRLTGTVK